jgi:hypothetical protein
MDYVIDYYFWDYYSNQVIEYPGFIYDNKRIFSKLYVFFKFIGLIIYISTLSNCNNLDFYISMIVVMFLSTINSARYEYVHYMRYGTIFSSINEYEIWKKEQYPKLRIFFSSIEIAIKIVFFIKTYPPQCKFKNLCEIGESIFKIHILGILLLYIIAGFFSMCILFSFYSFNNSQNQTISIPVPILLSNIQNEECCICLDIGENTWSMLLCGHKFHEKCITTWLRVNQTCPICRLHMNHIS